MFSWNAMRIILCRISSISLYFEQFSVHWSLLVSLPICAKHSLYFQRTISYHLILIKETESSDPGKISRQTGEGHEEPWAGHL